ncbi:MAG: Asp-tRNA(Asn)/Glu-tRNA(Gln) amidotransferase subunit GatB [Bacteroidota bacterium]
MSNNSIYDKYEVVVGLEVHAQLLTKSKAYSSDANSYGVSPNSLLSPVTLGLPGALPVMNKKSVELAVKVGLATHCSIREYNEFSRKNYFYADLPKGYQITQFDTPICYDGFITIQTTNGPKKIELERIHLEEDAGKSIHDLDPFNTLIDLNRAGVPLVEIVSRPDLRSGDEAYAFLSEVRKLLRYLDVCDGNMEEGSLRCDANISVRLKGATTYNQRVEVKNMNSMRNVKRAIEHEFIRQIDVLEAGGKITMETMNFDAVTGTTSSMRSKEMAHDYRYFPEPDLLPLIVDTQYIAHVKSSMPALPNELKKTYIEEYKLSEYDASILTEDRAISTYFNEIIAHKKDYKAATNWLIGPIKSYVNENAIHFEDFPLPSNKIVELMDLIESGKTNFSVASNVLFNELIKQPEQDALTLATTLNLIQNSNEDDLSILIDEVLLAFPEKVSEYKAGKKGLMGLFVGEVMKKSGGKADPKTTTKLLNQKLS